MEEENYLDKPASAIGADILRNIDPTLATVTTLGSTGALTKTFDPRLVGSLAEKQLIKRGQASLLNPVYQRFAARALPTALRNQGAMKLLGTATIPATTAAAAYDIVQDEAGRIGGEMQRLSDIEESQMQKAGSDFAERLRKLNLIEEQRAAEQGRSPFGGEEGITMGNLDEYFAANPNFSGIGDITLPGEEPRVAPVVQQTPVAPTMEGIDYSSAFAGGQPTAPTAPAPTSPMAPMSSPGFRPQFEGQTLGQFLRYEDTPEQATFQALDPQGRLRQFTADGQLAPNLAAFEAESAAREARIGPPRVGLGTAIPDTATGGMSMTDYRNLAEEELGTGAPSQAITARAKQLMGIQQAKDASAELASELTQAQIEKAKRPPEARAPSAAELGLAINQQLAGLQAKLDAGQELTPDELITYRGLNSYVQMQSKFGETPFQMPGDNDNESLGSESNPFIVTSQEEYDKVPKGQFFKDTSGKISPKS
jgi:hypothetical protein